MAIFISPGCVQDTQHDYQEPYSGDYPFGGLGIHVSILHCEVYFVS